MKRLGRWAGTGLTIAFIALFLGSLGAHFVASWVGYNQEAVIDGVAEISPLRYLASSAFWVEVMESWQSESLAVASMAIFSVSLRQQGSRSPRTSTSPTATSRTYSTLLGSDPSDVEVGVQHRQLLRRWLRWRHGESSRLLVSRWPGLGRGHGGTVTPALNSPDGRSHGGPGR